MSKDLIFPPIWMAEHASG